MDDQQQTPEEPQTQEPTLRVGENAADELFTIDNAIKSRLASLTKLKNDMKVQREMLTTYLENDESYRLALAEAKKANGNKNGVKALLLKNPEAANLSDTIKSIREQLAEVQEGLSYYLREYQRVTGANEFESDDGELQQIVYVAKLVKRNQFKK